MGVYHASLKPLTGCATIGGTIRTGIDPKGLFRRELEKAETRLDRRIARARRLGMSYGEYVAKGEGV